MLHSTLATADRLIIHMDLMENKCFMLFTFAWNSINVFLKYWIKNMRVYLTQVPWKLFFQQAVHQTSVTSLCLAWVLFFHHLLCFKAKYKSSRIWQMVMVYMYLVNFTAVWSDVSVLLGNLMVADNQKILMFLSCISSFSPPFYLVLVFVCFLLPFSFSY